MGRDERYAGGDAIGMSEQDETKVVSGGRNAEWTHGIVNPPVYHASTCVFKTMAEFDAACNNPDDGLYYARRGTPTIWALESALQYIEPGSAGVKVCSSGVAAITVALLAVLKSGDHILISDSAYEPTRMLANGLLKRMNIETTYFDPMIGADIKSLFKPNTTAVWVESPGSLTFEVQDVPAIAAEAHAHGACVLMDNTWATSLFYPAHERGVDIVMQSLTKYVCGHSDILMGGLSANAAWWPRLKSTFLAMGQCSGPDDVYLALRGLRTMALRLKQHEQSALTVAHWCATQSQIMRVLHPALPSCPGHEIWQRDFSGSSGLFSIQLIPGGDVAAMLDHMAHFSMGFSWGGYESLALPCQINKTNRSLKFWDEGGPLIRLHIGLENVDDLLADLVAGLKRYTR
jgi:cysteine-S-conjugate beta-lyase